jgi:hypothetical protein
MNVGRTVLIGSTAFLGLTAIAGGIALLTEVIDPGLGLLDGSPFEDYLVPGLSLTGLGVLSAASSMLVWRRVPGAEVLCAMAGIGIVIYETVEVAVIGRHFLQALYAALGVGILALAAIPPRGGRRQAPGQ